MYKYIVIKKDVEDDRVYEVYIKTDQELKLHVAGTFDNTDHVILSITNVRPEQ